MASLTQCNIEAIIIDGMLVLAMSAVPAVFSNYISSGNPVSIEVARFDQNYISILWHAPRR